MVRKHNVLLIMYNYFKQLLKVTVMAYVVIAYSYWVSFYNALQL